MGLLAGRKLVKQAEKYQIECNQQYWPCDCFGRPSSNIFTGVSVWDLVLLVVCLPSEAQVKHSPENIPMLTKKQHGVDTRPVLLFRHHSQNYN